MEIVIKLIKIKMIKTKGYFYSEHYNPVLYARKKKSANTVDTSTF